MSRLVLVVGCVVLFWSFFLSVPRILNCLILLENFNVLLLFVCLLSQSEETFIFFIALMVIFTVEVVLGLMVLVRIWESSGLIDLGGW